MPRVAIDVLLKPEILDPAGQAVANALPSLGLPQVTSVRIGKHVVVELEAESREQAVERVTAMADTLLANPVIEDFRVRGAEAG